MPRNRSRLLCLAAVLCAAGMLFFTFFNLAIFSDRGLVTGFEIPIGTKGGPLEFASDLLYTAAPFCLLLSYLFSLFFRSRFGSFIAAVLCGAPLTCYGLLELAQIVEGKELPLSVIVTLVFLILEGGLVLAGALNAGITRLSAYLASLHVLTELGLLVFSVLMKEKFSQFYFYELLPFGKTQAFVYWFFVASICFYFLFYSLSLLCRGFALTKAEEAPLEAVPEQEKKTEDASPISESEKSEETNEANEEEEEENDIPISLEDLGLER
ncbi:MAG: hypothetical protein IKC69_04445 [Clostridia bacterium]|nr:hypothetical protein [Clostridia bacterium]